ncbi:MAG: protein kinase family protein [Rickettsiales bacterium]|jgi:serine/threonine protein kinase|nr:protein kinase family protein [Rickettsiales bacterium]
MADLKEIASMLSLLPEKYLAVGFPETGDITKLGEGTSGTVFRIGGGPAGVVTVKETEKSPYGECLYLIKQRNGLESPALMKIHCIGSLGSDPKKKQYLIVSEYCGKKSLMELLGNRENIELWNGNILAILRGLRAMHDNGLFHGDIKPANIMVDDSNGDTKPQLRLIDFGASGEFEDGTDFPQKPTARGTPSNMTLELLAVDLKVVASYNARTADYWALGLSIYESITGTLPYNFLYSKPGGPSNKSELFKTLTKLNDSDRRKLFREHVRTTLETFSVPSRLIEVVGLLLEPNRAIIYSMAQIMNKIGVNEIGAGKRKEGGGTPATEKKNDPAEDIIIDLEKHKEMERVSEEAGEISKALLSRPPELLAPNSQVQIKGAGVTIDGKPVEILYFNSKCSIYSFEGSRGPMSMAVFRGKAKQGEGFSLIWEEQSKGRLASPALAKLHHFTETDSHHVLVFDPADDRGLLDTIPEEKERINFLNRNTITILGALETLHGRSIFHGRLRENVIMVAEGPRALIFGFECARKFGTDGTLASAESMKIEAPYRPPEICDFRARGEQFVAGSVSLGASRVDSWALGVIFLKIVTGKFPHEFITPPPLATTEKNPSAATVMAELYRSPQTQRDFRRKLRNALIENRAPAGMAVVTVLLLEPNPSIALDHWENQGNRGAYRGTGCTKGKEV